MSIASQSEVSADKMLYGMTELSLCQADRRDRAVASIFPGLAALVRNVELNIQAAEGAEVGELEKFVQLAKIYTKALRTYSARTDAWLAVFLLFKALIGSNIAMLRIYGAGKLGAQSLTLSPY